MKFKSSEIYLEIFKSITIVIIILSSLVSIFVTFFIFSRYETNVKLLLERSLLLGEKEYQDFFDKTYAQLLPLRLQDVEDISAYLEAAENYDLWMIVDTNGYVLSTNGIKGQSATAIASRFSDVWTAGKVIRSNEKYSHNVLFDFNYLLAKQAQVNDYNSALFQIVAIPIYDNQKIAGAIIVGHLLNNDVRIVDNYSRIIPGSFMSVSCEGIRIATNLRSELQHDFSGSHQAQELIATIAKDRTFFGQVQLERDDTHFVMASPLKNHNGDITGAITIGVPLKGLANLKGNSVMFLILSLIISIAFALVAASIAAKKVSQPIVGLSKLTQQICATEEVISEHLQMFEQEQPSSIQEIRSLQKGFQRMAHSLYQKCRENSAYLNELEEDKTELTQLTQQLQEINTTLENKVAEQTADLHLAINELKTSNYLKSKFLANMSHELRTPLNSIIGFTQMLHDELRGNLNKIQKEYTDIILTSAKHLLEIINDILDLSLIEQNRTLLLKEKVNLTKLIRSVETVVRPQAETHGLTMMVESPQPDIYIFADPTRIKQILYNLLTNAIKFTPEGGSIQITLHAQNGETSVSVRDTGIGMKEEDCIRVFDEFYQVEDTYKRKFAGVGLGLPLAKRLIVLHGGRIELSSATTRGTIVTFYLPLYQEGVNTK